MDNKKRKVDELINKDNDMCDTSDDDVNKSLDAIIHGVSDSPETNYLSSILYRSRAQSEFTKHKNVYRLKIVIHASDDHLIEVKNNYTETQKILDQYIKVVDRKNHQMVQSIQENHTNNYNLLKNLISKMALKKKESKNYLREIFIKAIVAKKTKSKRKNGEEESDFSFLLQLSSFHANTIIQILLDYNLTKRFIMEMDSIKGLGTNGYTGTLSSGQITLRANMEECPIEYEVFKKNPLTYKAILLQILHASLFVGEIMNKTKLDNHFGNYVLDFQDRCELLSVAFNHQSIVPYRCTVVIKNLPRLTNIDWEKTSFLANSDTISPVFPFFSSTPDLFSKIFRKFNKFYNFKVDSNLQGTLSFYSIANAQIVGTQTINNKYSISVVNHGIEIKDLGSLRHTLTLKNSNPENYKYYSFIEDCFDTDELVVENILSMSEMLSFKTNNNATNTNSNNNCISGANIPPFFKDLVFQERIDSSPMFFIFKHGHIEPKQKRWPKEFDKRFQDVVYNNADIIFKRSVKLLKLLCFFIKNSYSYYKDTILGHLQEKLDVYQVDGMCIKDGVIQDPSVNSFLKEKMFLFKANDIIDLTQKIGGTEISNIPTGINAISLDSIQPISVPISTTTTTTTTPATTITATANIEPYLDGQTGARNYFEPGNFKDIFGLIYDDLSAILYVNKSFKFSRLGLLKNILIKKGTIITAYYKERALDYNYMDLLNTSKPEPIQFFGIGTMANMSSDHHNASIIDKNHIVDPLTKTLVKYLNINFQPRFYLISTEDIPANKEIIIINQ
uniref:G1-like ORF's protein n=1 Tax=Dictyostelium mucoroides TaxID=31287 RepID=Q24014_DICMU|nr:G1-like ORF's protein [Dictyostelium mucoroides]